MKKCPGSLQFHTQVALAIVAVKALDRSLPRGQGRTVSADVERRKESSSSSSKMGNNARRRAGRAQDVLALGIANFLCP